MQGRQWQIRPYRQGDEAQLLALHERVFGKTRTLEDWHWKFMARQADFPHVWVAELPGSDRLVGHYAGIPLKVKLGEQQVDALVSIETMTDPEYRRQGMLTSFGEIVYSRWAGAEQSLIIGLPNQQWGSRKDALGWIPLFPLSWLRFPLRPEKVVAASGGGKGVGAKLARLPLKVGGALWLARTKRNARNKDITIRTFDGDPEAFNQIWQSARSTWTNIVVRDSEWVMWRYATAPIPYRIHIAWRGDRPVGYIAFRTVGPPERLSGNIADIFTMRGDHHAIKALAVSALDIFRNEGVDLASTLAVPGTELYRTLRRLGFFASPGEHSFSFEAVPLDPAITPGNLGAIQDWHVAGGDSDVI